MTNVLIAFYSRSGTVESLAKAVADGAREEGAEVRLRRAREVVGPEVMAMAPGWTEGAQRMNALYEAPTPADAEWADAIVLGTPTRFGIVSSELKAYMDGLGGLWAQGKLAGKVGSVFSATSSLHGGNEATILSLWAPLAHWGMVIVPLGYTDPVMFNAGTPYGATAATGRERRPITDAERHVAHWQGRRVAQVAAKLRA
ncbi:MAG: NAD(P)H:quinone oxidoreductase [Acetobacteraceae bacterium]|nr:NAD(P)H:quinone oxidoreductase [Acetobacteraceae bacterium]